MLVGFRHSPYALTALTALAALAALAALPATLSTSKVGRVGSLGQVVRSIVARTLTAGAGKADFSGVKCHFYPLL